MNATPGRHRPRPAPPRPLAPSVWQRVRRTVTAGVFLTATVAGVGVGLQGAQVSPVAPPPAGVATDVAAAADAPAVTVADGPPLRVDRGRGDGGQGGQGRQGGRGGQGRRG